MSDTKRFEVRTLDDILAIPGNKAVHQRLLDLMKARKAIAFAGAACTIAVSVYPGATVLTVVPWAALSSAKVLVKPMAPALAAAWLGCPSCSDWPFTELIFLIRPKLRVRMSSVTARQKLKAPSDPYR